MNLISGDFLANQACGEILCFECGLFGPEFCILLISALVQPCKLDLDSQDLDHGEKAFSHFDFHLHGFGRHQHYCRMDCREVSKDRAGWIYAAVREGVWQPVVACHLQTGLLFGSRSVLDSLRLRNREDLAYRNTLLRDSSQILYMDMRGGYAFGRWDACSSDLRVLDA